MGELETCIAVLFKRLGKNVITKKEFVFSASIDFRWFSPGEAESLLNIALNKGLLTTTEDYLKPTFNIAEVEAPLSFKPTKEVLIGKKEELSVFAQILKAMADSSKLGRRDLVARINKVQERLGVDIEVAALLVARDLNVDVTPYIDPVTKEVLGR